MQVFPHGNIDQSQMNRKNDYLFRLSIKALIRNPEGHVLVVKEAGRSWWDLPGGGMDHGETIHEAIARELKEEVDLEGNFSLRILAVDDPAYLEGANLYQIRLIYEVYPEKFPHRTGVDSDELMYINPSELELSANEVERRVYSYSTMAGGSE